MPAPLLRLLLLAFLLKIGLTPALGQEQRVRFPVWTFHSKNVVINGLSVGIASVRAEPKNTTTNGVKLEVPGIGIFVMMAPSLVADNAAAFEQEMQSPLSEQINGLSLAATGTVCDCEVNGLAIGGMGQYLARLNGVSFNFFISEVQRHYGIQLTVWGNDAYELKGLQAAVIFNEAKVLRGIQIGIYNVSRDTRGVQIGVWNVNERRKLPFINWSFRGRRQDVR